MRNKRKISQNTLLKILMSWYLDFTYWWVNTNDPLISTNCPLINNVSPFFELETSLYVNLGLESRRQMRRNLNHFKQRSNYFTPTILNIGVIIFLLSLTLNKVGIDRVQATLVLINLYKRKSGPVIRKDISIVWKNLLTLIGQKLSFVSVFFGVFEESKDSPIKSVYPDTDTLIFERRWTGPLEKTKSEKSSKQTNGRRTDRQVRKWSYWSVERKGG